MEEEEGADPNLTESNQMSARKVQGLENEKMRLMRELEMLRNSSATRGPNYTQQNTNIDYRQAIRELSNKNNQLRDQLQRQRTRSRNKPQRDPRKYDDLVQKYETLQNDNMRIKRNLGYN